MATTNVGSSEHTRKNDMIVNIVHNTVLHLKQLSYLTSDLSLPAVGPRSKKHPLLVVSSDIFSKLIVVVHPKTILPFQNYELALFTTLCVN